MQLDGCVAWITGASSGIGRALALELARRGADVALSARRSDRLEQVAAAIEAQGRRALVAACDVRDDGALADTVERVAGALGRLDVAVANAGISVGGRVEDLDGAAWRRALEVNVVAAAMTARYALPTLRQTRGRLALVGSVAAYLPAPSFGAYHASKYALRALGHTLSAELAGSGVSCTTVHPGFVESEISRVGQDGRFDPARIDPRPAPLMWPADRAARVMLAAILARRRELVFTAHGRAAAFLGMHFPALAHFVMTRGAMRAQADGFVVK